MKVQWRVAVCCAVVFIGWIVAEEADRRKLIIHVPHVHRAVHKHVPRHTHKGTSHSSKGHERPGDHVHKHHHHFHDEEYGEGSHGHGYEDHGHHHTRKYRRNPHHHHSSSGHRHHHSHPGHHYDHHGHDSHHVEHHRHPEHHDDDFPPRYRTEESRYHYDHYPEHSHHHHRPHRYEEDEEYDCMEVCEKCKMAYHRKHIMRAESESSASRPHPQLTVAKLKPPSSPNPASYMTRVKDEFKPSLAAGELSETPTGYDDSKYAGYILPTAIDHAANSGKLNSINSPLRTEGNVDDYGNAFPGFQNSDFMPSGSWQNGSYYYGKYKDPMEKVVEYNVQRGQIKHTRYGEEEIRHEDTKNNGEGGRDLRYLNRYKYIKR